MILRPRSVQDKNRHLRDELLKETLFPSLHHARATLAASRKDYNTERPHSRLGWPTQAEFAQTFARQRGLTRRNPQNSAPAPVAQPAHLGKLKPGVSLTLDKAWVQHHVY